MLQTQTSLKLIYIEKWNQLRRAQQEFDCFSAYCL